MEVDLNQVVNRLSESASWRRVARTNERSSDFDAAAAHALMAIAESLEALALVGLLNAARAIAPAPAAAEQRGGNS